MKILVAAGTFPPATKSGGPARSISGVVSAESHDHEITVLTSSRDLGDKHPMPGTSGSPISRLGAVVYYLNKSQPLQLVQCMLIQGRSCKDVLYLNSLFSLWFSLLPLTLWRLRLLRARTLLIAPRGELSPAALRIKGTKKRLALPFIMMALRGRSVVWQGTSETEAANIRHLTRSSRIIQYANSWPMPSEVLPAKSSVLTIVYLGRIATIKNPITALDALREIKAPVEFAMVGTPENTILQRQCEEVAAELPSNISIAFSGHQSPEEVHRILSKAHVLILPTDSENFGYAIAEALSTGCVPLIPDTTLWSQLVNEGIGKFITTEPSPGNRNVLRELSRHSLVELRQQNQQVLDTYTKHWKQHVEKRESLFSSLAHSVIREV